MELLRRSLKHKIRRNTFCKNKDILHASYGLRGSLFNNAKLINKAYDHLTPLFNLKVEPPFFCIKHVASKLQLTWSYMIIKPYTADT